ncbi:MAG TPA: hypothetical protein VNK95_18095 [Caldilineaceae bacterium]|nr:hypothetical protein [Caldilineaceae bacterium]
MTALTFVLVLALTAFANAAVGTAGGDSNATVSEGSVAEGDAVDLPATGELSSSPTAEPSRARVSAIMDQYPNGTLFSVTLRQGDVVAAIKQNGARLARVSSSGEAIEHSIVPLWQIASLQPTGSAQPSPVSPPSEPAQPTAAPSGLSAPPLSPPPSLQPNSAQLHLNQSLFIP